MPSGTTGGINLYAYGSNDPTLLTDPLGQWPVCNSACQVIQAITQADQAIYNVASKVATNPASSQQP